MQKTTLHITNGSVLTNVLKDLDVKGDFLTWEEMLCEGPTVEDIESDEFIKLRKDFFDTFYDLELDEETFFKDLDKLNHPELYSEIVLWFEYDLFCHINLVAAIHFIKQKQINLPIYLVCSGRLEGTNDLKGLGELLPNQLLKHYKDKIQLTVDDIKMASTVWGIYCGKDHNLLLPFITQESSFKYLSSCLIAHLKRFPNSSSGLNRLEKNILELINNNTIKSKHHLLGYILNYQGYYGFGDLQLIRLIKKASIFFTESDTDGLQLNRKGHEALMCHHNFSSEIHNNIVFGGVNRLDFNYYKQENKLIKNIINAY